jgi:ribonuclease J
VFLLDPGDVLELSEGEAKRADCISAGSVNVDGLGVGDVGEVVLRDRQQMAAGGIILPVLVIDAGTCEPVAPPDVYSRGLVYVEESAHLMDRLKDEISATAEAFLEDGDGDPETLRRRLRNQVRKAVHQLTERRPIVLPIVIELGAPPEDEQALAEEEPPE